MAPLFEHYGVQLWMPEAGGRVDFASEHDEQTMTVLGLASKREVTRTSIRVRTAMAVQVREQGQYLGDRLGDASPQPNKAHADIPSARPQAGLSPRPAGPSRHMAGEPPDRPLTDCGSSRMAAAACPGLSWGRWTQRRIRSRTL